MPLVDGSCLGVCNSIVSLEESFLLFFCCPIPFCKACSLDAYETAKMRIVFSSLFFNNKREKKENANYWHLIRFVDGFFLLSSILNSVLIWLFWYYRCDFILYIYIRCTVFKNDFFRLSFSLRSHLPRLFANVVFGYSTLQTIDRIESPSLRCNGNVCMCVMHVCMCVFALFHIFGHK